MFAKHFPDDLAQWLHEEITLNLEIDKHPSQVDNYDTPYSAFLKKS